MIYNKLYMTLSCVDELIITLSFPKETHNSLTHSFFLPSFHYPIWSFLVSLSSSCLILAFRRPKICPKYLSPTFHHISHLHPSSSSSIPPFFSTQKGNQKEEKERKTLLTNVSICLLDLLLKLPSTLPHILSKNSWVSWAH